MIQYVTRKDLDISKYDACVEQSIQSRMYAFSWYLDIVTAHWDVLVLDDYQAVMPIPWKKKLGIKYVAQPFWTLELGVFSQKKNIELSPFLDFLFTKFKYINLRTNTDNKKNSTLENITLKQVQLLSIQEDYDFIFQNFRKDRRKDLNKANKSNLREKWNDSSENLIHLFKQNVGLRTPYIKEKDYTILEKLITTCIEKKCGKILSIYNSEEELVASGFFLIHQEEIIILVSSTDFKNRKSGANTFLIDRAICKLKGNHKTFNFGGSSIKSIASYFLSFGAETKEYQEISYNNFPFFIKWFKS